MRNEALQADLQAALGDTYTIERELPRGGMSRVFVATETALKRRVVIKVLLPELAAGLSAERFKREIVLAARLQHPHIVPLLAAGQAGSHLYYTMPLVDGESLREKMVRERPMDLAAVSDILQKIAEALSYAHDEGIAHRDIKPENIMFFHGEPVILDFGIGKALAKSATNTDPHISGPRITMPGMSLGTPTYIAPEQAMGDPDIDHRVDLYALGVVAYEMITGHPPFADRSPQVVMEAHANKAPAPIAPRRPETPKHMVDVVMRCLAKKPSDRPANGVAIATALVTGASSPRATSGMPTWVPWAIAGVATVVALVSVGVLLTR